MIVLLCLRKLSIPVIQSLLQAVDFSLEGQHLYCSTQGVTACSEVHRTYYTSTAQAKFVQSLKVETAVETKASTSCLEQLVWEG